MTDERDHPHGLLDAILVDGAVVNHHHYRPLRPQPRAHGQVADGGHDWQADVPSVAVIVDAGAAVAEQKKYWQLRRSDPVVLDPRHRRCWRTERLQVAVAAGPDRRQGPRRAQWRSRHRHRHRHGGWIPR